MARVDGRSFSSFTKGMKRPFDLDMTQMMIETTKLLVAETNASLGYTQSDEISLTWHSLDRKSQIWFDGRIAKMTSQLGALATLYFYRQVLVYKPEYANKLPSFDARVWQVPNRTEAANVFLWREWDATKNSISMAASEYFSHNELHGKNSSDKHELLFSKGINWAHYPAAFKRGTYVQRRRSTRKFTAEELQRLPEKHAARSDPDLSVERWSITEVEMPPFAHVSNREDVVFEGAEPLKIAEPTVDIPEIII